MVKAVVERYSYHTHCWFCDSTLLYNERDIEIERKNYSSKIRKYITCPTCEKETEIREAKNDKV